MPDSMPSSASPSDAPRNKPVALSRAGLPFIVARTMGRSNLPMRIMTAMLMLAGIAAPSFAEPLSKRNQLTAFFSRMQEGAPITPDQLAAHKAEGIDDPESIAADLALNDWKTCVIDALPRWADLGQGPGTIVDGAFGRCADVQALYRTHLQRMTQDGRQVMDLQMARTMTRSLEEAWRPRLIAAALDQMLAARRPPAAAPAPAG